MADKWMVAATPMPKIVETTGGYVKSQTSALYDKYSIKVPSFFLGANGSGVIIWPSFTFAGGVVGVAYSQDFDLTPALSPTTFTVQSGSLPPGLTLSNVSGDKGRLSGTPTTAGTYVFTLRATNSLGTADQSFTIVVTAASGGESSSTFIA